MLTPCRTCRCRPSALSTLGSQEEGRDQEEDRAEEEGRHQEDRRQEVNSSRFLYQLRLEPTFELNRNTLPPPGFSKIHPSIKDN